MTRLNHKDWQVFVSAIGDLHSDIGSEQLIGQTLKAVSKVIGTDSVAFTGFNYDGTYADVMWNNDRIYSLEEMEIFAAYIHENPLFDEFFVKRRAEVLKITDLMPTTEFERTTIYNEFYRPVGVSNQMVTPLVIGNDLTITCSLNIEKNDFSERDRQILSLFAPHLVNAIRNTFAYQRLSGALNTEKCSIIALNSKGKAVFISEFARKLFGKYFAGEKSAANELPETLDRWIRQNTPNFQSKDLAASFSPLKVLSQNGELTASLGFNQAGNEMTVMLEEKKLSSPERFVKLGLTKREAEILYLITQGKSDEIIANLCDISPRTVHKHVQNIYVKLGVETRTAAMLRALEML